MIVSNTKNWFDVDKNGLRQLQLGKPKTFIINELCQNAFDENIKKCILDITYDLKRGEATVRIEDDSPEGFKDVALIYTMFADTLEWLLLKEPLYSMIMEERKQPITERREAKFSLSLKRQKKNQQNL